MKNCIKFTIWIVACCFFFAVFASASLVFAEDISDYRELLTGYLKPIARFEIKIYDALGNLKASAISSESNCIGQDIPFLNAELGDKLVVSDLSYSRAGYYINEWDLQYYSDQETCLRRSLNTDVEIALTQPCIWDFYLCVKDSAPRATGIDNWSDNGNHRAIGASTEDFPGGLYWYFTKITVNVASIPEEQDPIEPIHEFDIRASFTMPNTGYEGVEIQAVNTSLIDGIDIMNFIGQQPQNELCFEWEIEGDACCRVTEENIDRLVFKPESGIYQITLKIWAGESMGQATRSLHVFTLPIAKISCNGDLKVNRKLTLSCNDSLVRDGYPINHALDNWKIISGETDVLDDEEFVAKRPYNNGIYELMFRKPGQYRIELLITDSRSMSACTAKTISISDDIEPIAKIQTQSTVLRDPSNTNKASIKLSNACYSLDGDIIGRAIWEAYYDSDNDGSFDDEENILKDGLYDNLECSYHIDNVGRLLNKLTIYENIHDDNTLSEFLAAEDYKSSSTSTVVEVINVAPVVSFDASTQIKSDINFIINEADNVSGLMDNIACFSSELFANNIDNNVSVYLHQPERQHLVEWDGKARNSNGVYSETGGLVGDKTQFYSTYNYSGSPYVRCYDENFNYLWTYTPPSVKNNISVGSNAAVDGVYILYKKSTGYEYAKLDKYGQVVWTCPSEVKLKAEPFWNDIVVDNNGNIVSPDNIDNNGCFYLPDSQTEPFPYTLRTSGKRTINIKEEYINDWCFVSGSYEYGRPLIQVFHRNDGYLFEVDFPSDYYSNFGYYVYGNTLVVFRHYKKSKSQKTEVLFYDLEKRQLEYIYPLFPNLSSSSLLYTVQQGTAIHDRYVFFANHRHKGFLLDIKQRTVLDLNDATNFIDNLFFSHNFTRLNTFIDWGNNGTVYSHIVSKPTLNSYAELFPKLGYREQSYIYNVLVNSGSMRASTEEIANLLTAMRGKTVFVGSNDGGKVLAGATKGLVLPYKANMQTVIDDIASYIVEDVEKDQMRKAKDSVLVNEEIVIDNLYYSDYENDPPDNVESWKYCHEPNYYENNNGIVMFDNKELSEPIICFDKVGKYEITYRKPDDPTKGNIDFDNYKKWSLDKSNYTLYVHRQPIAQFKVTGVSSNQIFIENNSYDPDRQSLALSAIKTTEIRYGIQGLDSMWSTVYNTDTLPAAISGEYIIALRVQDLDGAWSDYKYEIVNFNGDKYAEEIILDFIIPDSVRVGQKITPVDFTSITTYGNPVQRMWHYFDGVKWLEIDRESFENGNYFFDEPETYNVRLTGSYENQSSSVIRSIIVTPVEMEVSLSINPNPAKAGEEILLTGYVSGNLSVERVKVIFDKPIIDSLKALTDTINLNADVDKNLWANVVKIGEQVTDTDILGSPYKARCIFDCEDNYSFETQVDLHIKTPVTVMSKVVCAGDLIERLRCAGIHVTWQDVNESYLDYLTIDSLEDMLNDTNIESQAAGEEIMVLSCVKPDDGPVICNGSEFRILGAQEYQPMVYVKSSGSTMFFAKKLVIPVTTQDGNCKVQVKGYLKNDMYGCGSSGESQADFNVFTPIRLRPFINGASSDCELFDDRNNIFTAMTSVYASELSVELNGKVYISHQHSEIIVLDNELVKTWVIGAALDGENYSVDEKLAVKFTAKTPSGKSQQVILNASMSAVTATNFTITLINNSDWRAYYFDLDSPQYVDGQLCGYRKNMDTEIKTINMPVNTSPQGEHPISYNVTDVKAGTQIKGYIEVKGSPNDVVLVAGYIDKDCKEVDVDIPTMHNGDGIYTYEWVVPLDTKSGSFVEFAVRILKNSVEYGNEKWIDAWNEGSEFKVLYIEGNVLEDDILFNQSN